MSQIEKESYLNSQGRLLRRTVRDRTAKREWVRERECVCVSVGVHLGVCERVCMLEWDWERERQSERERDKKRERERGQIILVGIFDSFYTPGKILNWGPGVIQKNQVSFFFFLKRTFFSIWLHPQKDILRGKRNELIFRPPFPFPALTNLYFELQTAYFF